MIDERHWRAFAEVFERGMASIDMDTWLEAPGSKIGTGKPRS
jgi:hypothetical protein